MALKATEGIESLRGMPLFSEVAEPDLRKLADQLIERRFPRDATIIQEGQPGDYMYVLREGRVKVTKISGAGREKILEILGAGAFFGEMALLDPPERSASVKSLDPVRLLDPDAGLLTALGTTTRYFEIEIEVSHAGQRFSLVEVVEYRGGTVLARLSQRYGNVS